MIAEHDLKAMSTMLVSALAREPDLRTRMEAAAKAITALNRFGLVEQAAAIFSTAVAGASARDWQNDNSLLSPVATLEPWLDSICALFIGLETAGADQSVRDRLLQDAWIIVNRCETSDAQTLDQQTRIPWKLLQTLASCGRLEEAIAQLPTENRKERGIRAYDLAQLQALAWEHGYRDRADEATARPLASDPDMRFDLANTRLGVGDREGAERLAIGLPENLIPVFAEHLVRFHAARGDFATAMSLRSSCRHGERSCAEVLTGLACEQQRWEIARAIIAQELAMGGPDAPVTYDFHWMQYRSQVGDDRLLLQYFEQHLDDDPAGCAEQLATYARFLRVHRRRPKTLCRLGDLAYDLATSPGAKRTFVYYEYGQCIVAAMAAGNQDGMDRIVALARRKSGWWSNLEVCYERLCVPGSDGLAVGFFSQHGRLLNRDTTSQRCLSHLCQCLAAKGRWRRAREIAATHRWKRRTGLILSAILAGMADHLQRVSTKII